MSVRKIDYTVANLIPWFEPFPHCAVASVFSHTQSSADTLKVFIDKRHFYHHRADQSELRMR